MSSYLIQIYTIFQFYVFFKVFLLLKFFLSPILKVKRKSTSTKNYSKLQQRMITGNIRKLSNV